MCYNTYNTNLCKVRRGTLLNLEDLDHTFLTAYSKPECGQLNLSYSGLQLGWCYVYNLNDQILSDCTDVMYRLT